MTRIRWSLTLALAVLAAAPATGSAAVIFHDDGGGLTYRAAPGEANHLTTDPFGGPIEGVSQFSMLVADSGAPLRALDAFCVPGPPLQCPTVDFTALMGDRADHGEATPFFRNALILGQAGDDDLTASGRDHAEALGGIGDDTISAGADGDAVARGQSGDDVISAGTQSSLHLFGGDGDDAITTLTETFAPSVVDGGDGRDSIDVTEPSALLDVAGGGGADTISVARARSTDGEGGNDRITAHGSVRGGAGNDRIDVSGPGDAGDAVSCGAGIDAVTADAADSVAADCERVAIAP
jgi:hypothetical protein